MKQMIISGLLLIWVLASCTATQPRPEMQTAMIPGEGIDMVALSGD